MKMLIQTTGSFSLIDASQRLYINKLTPTVAESSHFVQERLGMGALKVLGQVTDEATQDEMLAYVKESEGDLELAVSAFLSKFGVGAEPVEAPVHAPVAEPKRKGRR